MALSLKTSFTIAVCIRPPSIQTRTKWQFQKNAVKGLNASYHIYAVKSMYICQINYDFVHFIHRGENPHEHS